MHTPCQDQVPTISSTATFVQRFDALQMMADVLLLASEGFLIASKLSEKKSRAYVGQIKLVV